ncbi:MAG: MATE family efflux transporter [Eubacterium sp.]|nr:MATE family efflux transporter [Eubacterium sp.]
MAAENTKKQSLFKLTWPIFIELFLQMLVGNMDQMMVGQVSTTGVGAIGNSNQIINVLLISFSIISLATTILVSQNMGAKNYKNVSTIYTLALFVNLFFSIVISAVLLIFTHQIYGLLQVPAEIMQETVNYTRIIGAGLFLQAVFLTFSAIFRSNYLMKQTMIVSVIMNVLNIVGNYILINGIGLPAPLGVVGAAISSDISKLVGVVIVAVLFKKKIRPGMSLKTLKPFPVDMLKRLLFIGVPSGGETLSYTLSQTVTMGFVNLCGTVVIPTRVYAVMFAMLTYLYSNAISQSSQVLVGHMIGARSYEDADKRTMATIRSSVIVSVIMATLIYIFSDQIFGIFTTDPQVLALGKQVMFIDIFLEIGRAVNMVMVRSLQAANDILFPIGLGIGSQWFVSVVLCYVLGIYLGWGLVGIWIAMACDEILRAIMFMIRWKRRRWMALSIKNEIRNETM